MNTILVPVIFRFPRKRAGGASRVSVVGPFNGWDPTVHPLKRKPGGDWLTTVFLPPGPAVYCFWVDGARCLDPYGEGRLPNSHGAEYSVRDVRPSSTANHARST